uniref:Putative DNA binding, helix-turn-helix domain containing protein n=1 Tax=viral metagenome TaxID=1070528 RepID=A0A6M3KHR0_9ZZZZ
MSKVIIVQGDKINEVDSFYNETDTLKELGISRPTLFRWIKSGRIIPNRTLNENLYKISDIERLKNGNT